MLIKKIKNLAVSCVELLTLKETAILFKIKKKFRTPARTLLMKSASILGAAGFIWMPPALILLENPTYRLDGLLVFTSLGIDVALNNLFTKFFFHRIRPCVRYPGELQRGSLPYGFSFPSGHALTSSTGATIYILINPLNAIWSLPLAALICFARLYLFDHYPTDVAVGALDGIIEARLVYNIGHRIYNERKIPLLNAVLEDNTLFDFKNYFSRGGRREVLESLRETLRPFILS